MSFKDILREVVDGCDGGLAALMMGFDGIPVDEYQAKGIPLDLQLISVEYASLLKNIVETVVTLKSGNLDEVTVATDENRVVIRNVDEEYFVLLVLEKGGNLGKGRFLLQRAAWELREELR